MELQLCGNPPGAVGRLVALGTDVRQYLALAKFQTQLRPAEPAKLLSTNRQNAEIDTEHRYPWNSLKTIKSLSISSSNRTEESAVDAQMCLTLIHKETQTDEYLLLYSYLQASLKTAAQLLCAEFPYKVHCSECRQTRRDKVLRVCMKCSLRLCYYCEEYHNPRHIIKYLRVRTSRKSYP